MNKIIYKQNEIRARFKSKLWLYANCDFTNNFRVFGTKFLIDQVKSELKDIKSMRLVDQIHLKYSDLPKIIF